MKSQYISLFHDFFCAPFAGISGRTKISTQFDELLRPFGVEDMNSEPAGRGRGSVADDLTTLVHAHWVLNNLGSLRIPWLILLAMWGIEEVGNILPSALSMPLLHGLMVEDQRDLRERLKEPSCTALAVASQSFSSRTQSTTSDQWSRLQVVEHAWLELLLVYLVGAGNPGHQHVHACFRQQLRIND